MPGACAPKVQAGEPVNEFEYLEVKTKEAWMLKFEIISQIGECGSGHDVQKAWGSRDDTAQPELLPCSSQ